MIKKHEKTPVFSYTRVGIHLRNVISAQPLKNTFKSHMPDHYRSPPRERQFGTEPKIHHKTRKIIKKHEKQAYICHSKNPPQERHFGTEGLKPATNKTYRRHVELKNER